MDNMLKDYPNAYYDISRRLLRLPWVSVWHDAISLPRLPVFLVTVRDIFLWQSHLTPVCKA